MGWLVRYTGPAGTVVVPTRGELEVVKGEMFDVAPHPEVRRACEDPGQPWERVDPRHPDYIKPEDRT